MPWLTMISGRIDRLGSILINDFLPYYRHWPFNEPRWSKAFIELTRQGHDIWASNWVYQSKDHAYKVLSLKYVMISPGVGITLSCVVTELMLQQ